MVAAAPSAPKSFLAVSVGPSVGYSADIHAARRMLGHGHATEVGDDDIRGVVVGLDSTDFFDKDAGGFTVLLSREPRCQDRDLGVMAIRRVLDPESGDALALDDLLPPFAAVSMARRGSPLVAGVDRLGFRHLYYYQGKGWAALSTSARALATCASSELDLAAIGAQSLLGWQVGLSTPFAGVDKLPPASIVTLSKGEVRVRRYVESSQLTPAPTLNIAVEDAAQVLRTYVSLYLADHPDAVLQLTGGQDSRILLSAVPPSRRRGLEVMTLAVPGSLDVQIAADLAQRYGMVHHVIGFEGLESIPYDDAHRLAVAAARKLDCSADPLAKAALTWAEAKLSAQCRRISGLGGEVARGFYYVGRARPAIVEGRRVDRLAAWRLFANEAVADEVLEPDFAQWARDTTLGRLRQVLREYGPEWLRATDEFYLGHRIQRWAGVLASAMCTERTVVNPMFDRRFLDLARSVSPRFKRGSLFLSRILCELDLELARIPLDGRPPPAVYAEASVTNSLKLARTSGIKAARKVRQRLIRARRPPAAGPLLAQKVVTFWRSNPDSLDGVRHLGVFSSAWLDRLLAGEASADPATAALLVNLEVAVGDVKPSAGLNLSLQ